uniref:Uncharacterized protein n=1 Tax=Meloidogyne incognita TaxID=6306 RepID=A0A914NHN7_MELIC
MCQKSLRVIGYNANLNHQCKAVRNDNHVLNDESLPRQLFDWTNKHVLLGYGHHKDGPRFRWDLHIHNVPKLYAESLINIKENNVQHKYIQQAERCQNIFHMEHPNDGEFLFLIQKRRQNRLGLTASVVGI